MGKPVLPTEEQLRELLAFIRGEDKYSFLGGGIHTYPHRETRNIRLHKGCVEMESRGLIFRHIDEPNHVFFKATPNENILKKGKHENQTADK